MKKIIIRSFILLLSIAFLKVLLTKSVSVKTIRDLITSENKALVAYHEVTLYKSS